MTWVVHRANRSKVFNVEQAEYVWQKDECVMIDYHTHCEKLVFENEAHAMNAWRYLTEAIKRGDNLINL